MAGLTLWLMDEDLNGIIDALQRHALASADPLHQLQARLLHRLAVALAEDRKMKRQAVRAIAANLKIQRMIRQMIGRPRNTKGSERESKRKSEVGAEAPEGAPQDDLR